MEPSLIQKDNDFYYGYNKSHFGAIECGNKERLIRFSLTKLAENYEGWNTVTTSTRQVHFIFECPDEYSIVERVDVPEISFKGYRLKLNDIIPRKDNTGFNMG